ncbi:MAG: penicillin acylase family protein [Pseudomonadota bacterium]
MRRWLMRTAGALALLAGAAVLTVWLVLRASLPTLDGEVRQAGLSAAVTIERDADGIPTITAATREDLAFATGYAHAQDRYFQMDLIRRRSAGELSALIGSATLESDKRHRFHRFRSRARAVIENLPAADLRLLERYADGANAGLASLASRPFEYWLLRAEPEPWRAEDSVLVLYAMFMTLNDPRASRDVRRSFARNVFGDAIYDWLYPDGSSWDAPIVGAAREPLPVPQADALSVRDVSISTARVDERGDPAVPGSNNWAVSGALTATGHALVSNDMHLGIDVPNIYYQLRFVVTGDEDVDIMGVSLPGGPLIVAGSNEYLAWGYTNSYGDWSDAILLEPGSAPGTYRTPEGDRAFTELTETIEIKGAPDFEYTLRETIWGPVEDRIEYPHGEIAVNWIAHHVEAVNFNVIRLERARSVEEAMAVANTMGIPPQNFVCGDRDGNIGWTIAGRIPLRQGFDPALPSDWSAGAGWRGWLSPMDYPRVLNPPGGRIWTANTRVVDGEALALIGDGGYDRGARAAQIRDALLAEEQFDAEAMLAIQTDDRAVFLARWHRLLIEVLDAPDRADTPQLAEYLRLTRDWLPRAAPESVGYRLVRSFRLQVQARVWEALTAPVREVYGDDVDVWRSPQFEDALWQLVNERPPHLLPANYEDWDALLIDAVAGSIDYFEQRYDDTPLAERSWGERNRARIQHPLSLAVPPLSRWLDMPRDPLRGDADLPLAQSPGFGASERFSVSPGDRANGIMHMPTGQSGHPLSGFYQRGHDVWVEGAASPFLPTASVHRLTLRPAR